MFMCIFVLRPIFAIYRIYCLIINICGFNIFHLYFRYYLEQIGVSKQGNKSGIKERKKKNYKEKK